jgi:hypothetical protein
LSNICNDCKLKPCITIEPLEEITEMQYKEHSLHDKAREEGKKVRQLTAVNRSEKGMMKIMTRHFGREYTNKVGRPNCIMKEAYIDYEITRQREKTRRLVAVAVAVAVAQKSLATKRKNILARKLKWMLEIVETASVLLTTSLVTQKSTVKMKKTNSFSG